MPRPPHWTAGNVVEIKLPGAWAYGKVIYEPLIAFYPARRERIDQVGRLQNERFAFRIWVMNSAIGKKGWPVIGNLLVSKAESAEAWFFKKDPITGEITKYRGSTSEEIPATLAECVSLERAAVWSREHVESRLIDQFAGRPNVWVESMKPK